MKKPDKSDSVVLMTKDGRQIDGYLFDDDQYQGADSAATPDSDWPDPAIYGDPVIAQGKSKKRSYGLYLAFGLGFLFAEALTYFVAMPASFNTGYQAAMTDMRAALEAKGGQ